MDNYHFYLKTDLSPYLGQWIAIQNEKIVAHGKNVTKVIKAAKKAAPKGNPLLARVPDKEAMIL